MTAAPPDAAVTESTEQVFSAARDSFMAGDYQRALDLSDQVLKQTPNAGGRALSSRRPLSICPELLRRSSVRQLRRSDGRAWKAGTGRRW